jgi:hypothetical protein
MKMVEAAVVNKLRAGESVIYSGSNSKEFNFSGKSVVGTHYIYITNQGRFYAYDSGGMFGSEKVIEYPADTHKVDVLFLSTGVWLKNCINHALTFNLTISFDDFLQIYKQTARVIYNFNSYDNCIIRVRNSFQQARYVIEDKKITLFLLHNEKIEIPYTRIKSKKYNFSSLIFSLNGLFNNGKYTITELDLFFPSLEHLTTLTNYIDQSKNIFSFFTDNAIIASITIKRLSNSNIHNEYPALLIYEMGAYEVLNEESSKIEYIFNSNEDSFYYDSNFKSLLIVKKNIPYIVTFDAESKLTNKIESESLRLHRNVGQLTGTYKEQEITNVHFDIFYDGTGFSFLFIDSFSLTEKVLFKDTYSKWVEESLFIFSHDGIFKVGDVNNKASLSIVLKQEGKEELKDFGYFENGIPFLLIHDATKLSFIQSNSHKKEILNQDITDISIIDQNIDSNFSKIKICLGNCEVILFLNQFSIKEMIYSTFLYKKLPILAHTKPQQIFTSWSRQVNDYLLYHLFSQFFVIHSEMKEIQKEDISKELKQLKLINLLYYGLQTQKEILDTVSVYIPAMLDNEQQELFVSINESYNSSPFSSLQRNLLSVTSQMNRHINEVQGSLNAISFAIIPQKTLDDLIKSRLIRNGITAGVIAIKFLPAGLFMGLNSVFSYFDSKEQEKVRKENEQNKIDFYLNKAINTFEHFQEVMMPFYISEANQKMFQSFKQIAMQYQLVLDKEPVKEFLINKIAEMYTYKQLPMDNFNIKRKVELIGEIHKSTKSSFSTIKNYRNEVQIDVQKPLPIIKK